MTLKAVVSCVFFCKIIRLH